ncbi:MAG: integrase arm-type DNA-binding domain-containing protein, partial [Steroidobacteraceae bacterium]
MLSDAKIRSLKPKEKAYKVYDDRGLYMVVNPNGSRWWRFKYKYDGRERGISLGVYPDVTLQYAREQLQEARQLLARGIDPSAQRRTVKIARADTFKVIAEEWLEMQAERLAPITMTKARWILGSFVYPRLGSRPVAEITAPEVLAVLRPIESRGMNETAHRALQRCGQIFRYAIATGRATRDITSDLRGALAPVVVENRAAITEPAKIGALLRAIDDYIGHPTMLIALKLSPLVFLRPSELRAAEWSEIDLQSAEWRVPAARMKMRERHIVPLAGQAVVILRELCSVTGKGRYLFPSLRTSDRPMSVNTVNAALRRLGYARDEMTGHGFRAMACTCLNE